MSSSKDFTRRYKLVPRAIVAKILHSFSDSLAFDVNTFIPDIINKNITESAFSISRYKIKWEYFQHLFKWISGLATQCLPAKLWHGYRVLAADGTTISIPVSKETIQHFGITSVSQSGSKTVMANALIIYDALSNIIIDASISNSRTSEKVLLEQLLDRNNLENSILVTDRNFGCFHFYKRLINEDRKFCIRQRFHCCSFANEVLNDERDDFITTWIPTKKETNNIKIRNLDSNPITVRVTKIYLPSGEIELLISNLFDENIHREDFEKLYHLRWNIEEVYKQLKPNQKLEQFGSKKSQGIYQEYFAHLAMMNIVTIISGLTEKEILDKTASWKYEYKFNRVNAWKFLKQMIIRLMDLDSILISLSTLVKQISSSLIKVIPNRYNPREHKLNRKRRFSQNYK